MEEVIPGILIRTVIRFFDGEKRGEGGVDAETSGASRRWPASLETRVSIVVSFRYRGVKSSAIESAVTRNAVNCRVSASILIRFFFFFFH